MPPFHNGLFLLKYTDVGKMCTGLETEETAVKNTDSQQGRLWSCATTSKGPRPTTEQYKKGAWPLPVNFLTAAVSVSVRVSYSFGCF